MARKDNGTSTLGHRGNGNPHRASRVARKEQRAALRKEHAAIVARMAQTGI